MCGMLFHIGPVHDTVGMNSALSARQEDGSSPGTQRVHRAQK